MKKVLNWLNGKKTLIGTVLGVAYLGSVGMGLLERNEAVEWVITVVFGVGLAHKAVKAES